MSYKRITGFSSEHGPALTKFKDRYYLAWINEQSGLNVFKMDADTIESLVNPPVGMPHRPEKEARFRFKSGLENETSIDKPALAAFNDRLVLAWTGTDGAGHL